eukprot:14687008-Alexandrium_andersonii.AAC.1
MGMFGASSPKATRLWGSHKWLLALRRKLKRGAVKTDLRNPVVKNYIDKFGRRKVQGASGLKKTQSYPIEFGRALAAAYKKHMHELPDAYHSWQDL